MPTPHERIRAAWGTAGRRHEFPAAVEALAAEGVSLAVLDDALGRLLDEVRAAGADDATEEVILSVGDRLHGWCHPAGRIVTRPATDPAHPLGNGIPEPGVVAPVGPPNL